MMNWKVGVAWFVGGVTSRGSSYAMGKVDLDHMISGVIVAVPFALLIAWLWPRTVGSVE